MKAILRIFWAALLLASAGCTSYHYHNERWMVVDATTAKPIGGATVSVSYPSLILFDPFPPKGSTGITDKQGIVVLRAEDERHLRSSTAKAPGYGELDMAPQSFVPPSDIPLDRVEALRPLSPSDAR